MVEWHEKLGPAQGRAVVCSADDFPGLYNDDGSINFHLLSAAHDWCFRKFANACEDAAINRGAGVSTPTLVILDNTNTTLMEMSPYRMVARMHDLPLGVSKAESGMSDAELAERNTHGVPEQSIANMRARWEDIPPFWEGEQTVPTHGRWPGREGE
jgi:hypothetical protein